MSDNPVPSKATCPVCDTPDGDHLDWCTPQAREQRPSKDVSGPPFTVDRYGSFAEAVIAHRDWLSREIEELRRDNVRWENAHKILLAEIERLKRDLERAISNHSADLSSAPEPAEIPWPFNKAEVMSAPHGLQITMRFENAEQHAAAEKFLHMDDESVHDEIASMFGAAQPPGPSHEVVRAFQDTIGQPNRLLAALSGAAQPTGDSIVALDSALAEIDDMIVPGHLPGDGTDQTAQRNGIILAANKLREIIDRATPPPEGGQ